MRIRNLDSLLEAGGIEGKRVFVRADLNVPLTDGRIADTTRVRASLPTIRRLVEARARVIVASHLGRPRGKRDPALSLRPVAGVLASQLGSPVAFVDDCVGDGVVDAIASLAPGGVLLLENLRFHAAETENDPEFAARLAALADIYVNDAFGSAHRAHASTTGIVAAIAVAVAGDLLESELQQLEGLLDPEHPFLCLLGGAKVSDKLGVLEALAERADVLAIGGAMAYTFLAAQSLPVGNSLVEPDRYPDALRIQASAKRTGCRILLPSDHVVAESPEAESGVRVVETIPDGWIGFDIGPASAAAYAEEASRARMILWNGPMGMFERPAFAAGTRTVAQAVAASRGRAIVGGGDSLAAVNTLGIADGIDHLSTGGGAALEFVQGLELPGVAALKG